MDGEFMRMLQNLRDEMQGHLKVSSGFRCEDHNQMVSTTGRNGPHTLAKATDILISGERAMVLFEKARQIGFSGIGSFHHDQDLRVRSLEKTTNF